MTAHAAGAAEARERPTTVPERRRRAWAVAALAWIALLTTVYIARNTGYAVDDSYITFQYAANFAGGRGLVFNAGERYFGSTAMGFAIAEGAVAWVANLLTGADVRVCVPHSAVVLSGLSLATIAGVWLLVADRLGGTGPLRIAWIGLTAFAFSGHASNLVAGHETYPLVALLFVSVYLALFAQRPAAAGLVLAAATAVRPDAALFAAVLGAVVSAAADGVRQAVRVTSRLLVGYLLLAIPWSLFLWSYFGSPLPGTMLAKKAQVALGCWPKFGFRTAATQVWTDAPVVCLALAAVALAITVRRLTHRRHRERSETSQFVLVWGGFGLGLVVSYRAFGVTIWPWYLYPVHFGLLALALVGAKHVFAGIHEVVPKAAPTTTLALSVALAVGLGTNLPAWATTRNVWPHVGSYDPIVRYLREHEPDGATVATAEPGNLAYQLGSSFRVVDELGLTSPGVAQAILDGDGDFVYRTYRPDYVIVSWDGPYNMDRRPWFQDRYRLVGEFDSPYWSEMIHRGARLYVANVR